MFSIEKKISEDGKIITLILSGDLIINYISEIKENFPEPKPENEFMFIIKEVDAFDYSFIQFFAYYLKLLQSNNIKYHYEMNEYLEDTIKYFFNDLL